MKIEITYFLKFAPFLYRKDHHTQSMARALIGLIWDISSSVLALFPILLSRTLFIGRYTATGLGVGEVYQGNRAKSIEVGVLVTFGNFYENFVNFIFNRGNGVA